MSSFAKKHSLRQKALNSNDKSFKRWPKVQNWIDLFSSDLQVELKEITPSDLRHSNPKINIEKLLEKLVEAFAFKSDYDLEVLNPDDLLSLIRPKISDVIQSAKDKRYEHEKTKKDYEAHVKLIDKRRKNDQLSFFVGDLL